MAPVEAQPDSPSDELSRRACHGDSIALGELFELNKPRLRRMIQLRLDPRLAPRVDPDDVLQEAYLVVRRRLGEYMTAYRDSMKLSLWFRLVAAQSLIDLHRFHLGTAARDAGLEISLQRGGWPKASSASLAAQLLGKLTSATRAAIRAEQRLIVQEALNSMDEMDREILVLRHFEQLSNDEAAQLLGLKRTAASQRYVRALIRLKSILSRIPGMGELP